MKRAQSTVRVLALQEAVGSIRAPADAAGVADCPDARAVPRCFRTDERLFCRDYRCPLRAPCLRLVAEWKR